MSPDVEILLLEDNAGDIRLLQEAFKECKVKSRLHVIENGEEGMAFLQRQGRYAHAVRPDIILLDLNLPRKDGREVLAEIKRDPQLRQIPIIVLTTSQAESDVAKSYDLHGNCYITKPMDFDQFMSVVRSIADFWLAVVKLPQKEQDKWHPMPPDTDPIPTDKNLP
ncbi:MAG: response regulator [Nitrososphaera sp.]|nr:response regulator [Nitrososphaera sp.]